MKKEYKCVLLGFMGIRGNKYARIVRLESHDKLGEPKGLGQVTTTSRVVKHDPGRIETLHSVYLYDVHLHERLTDKERVHGLAAGRLGPYLSGM
jgi:hypothetical protein